MDPIDNQPQDDLERARAEIVDSIRQYRVVLARQREEAEFYAHDFARLTRKILATFRRTIDAFNARAEAAGLPPIDEPLPTPPAEDE